MMRIAQVPVSALRGLAVAALVLYSGGAAVGDTVFDNGPGNVDNGQDITTAVMAEDFELGASNVIRGATFSLLDLNGSDLAGWDGTLQWGVYAAVSGTPFTQTKPGALLFGGAGANISAVFDHQNPNGRQFYNVAFDFGQDVPIAANTRYWFGLHVNQDYTQQYLFWTQTSSAYFETTYARFGGQGNWFYQGLARNAFTLVPEPGTAGLSLIALAPLLWRRARG